MGICVAVATSPYVDAFTVENSLRSGFQNKHSLFGQANDSLESVPDQNGDNVSMELSRRKMMVKTAALASFSFLPVAVGSPASSSAAVGILPEFSDTNAIINGLTVNVADASQQQAMVDFLTGAFDFVVQRQRIQGSVEETVCIRQESVNTKDVAISSVQSPHYQQLFFFCRQQIAVAWVWPRAIKCAERFRTSSLFF